MRSRARIVLTAMLVVLGAGLAVLAGPASLLALPIIGMASETTTTTLIDEALKVIFGTTLHNDIVADSELMTAFQTEMNIKSEETTGGRYIEQGHFWQLPAGFGWRTEGDYIPEAVSAQFKNSRIFLRKGLVTLQMSGDTMRRVTGDVGAFLNYMEQAKPGVVEYTNNALDFSYIGFGMGILARIDGAAADLGSGNFSIVVKDHSGVAGWTEAWLPFLEGMACVFSSTAASTALKAAGATTQSARVTDINEDNSTITFAGNATLIAALADGDYIFMGDGAGHSGQASGVDRGLAGVTAAVDDGNILQTYNNIDRLATGNRLWRSVVVDAATNFAGELNEDCLDYAFRQSRIRGNGKPDFLIMSESARASWWKSVKSDKMFIDPGGTYKSGRGRLEVIVGDRTIPLRVARKLPPQVCFGLQSDKFYRLTLGQLTWEGVTGSMWDRVTDSTGRKDEFYAVAHMYEQLYTPAPRKSFRIDNLTPVI